MNDSPQHVSAIRALLCRSILPLALSLPSLAQEHRPAVFQALEFQAAQEAAAGSGGLLILDAMTSWCGPCKQMDRTTWVDPRLVEWIEANAVAIQLDMDEHEELKKSLEIRAFPTILLFKDGVEFDRVVGLRSADEMLAWLGAGLEGKRARDTVLERLGELRSSDDVKANWGERAKLVEDLKWFGENEEALREHLWLWANASGSEGELSSARQRYRWGAQRYSMREIAGKLPAALASFRELRDGLTADVLAGTADAQRQRDWIELNFVISDEAATVRWADSLAQSQAGVARLRQLELRIFDLLIAHDSWSTAGLVLADPVERTRQQRASLGAYDEGPTGGPSQGGVMPAIPIGGMKPARRGGAEEAGSEPTEAEAQEASASTREDVTQEREPRAKSTPAIPMQSGAPKRAAAMPMIPMGGGSDPKEDTATTVRRLLTEQFRSQASERYGALLAAQRDEEARAVADILLEELDDSRARAALLSTALRADGMQRARQVHQSWLDWMAR